MVLCSEENRVVIVSSEKSDSRGAANVSEALAASQERSTAGYRVFAVDARVSVRPVIPIGSPNAEGLRSLSETRADGPEVRDLPGLWGLPFTAYAGHACSPPVWGSRGLNSCPARFFDHQLLFIRKNGNRFERIFFQISQTFFNPGPVDWMRAISWSGTPLRAPITGSIEKMAPASKSALWL